MDYTAENYTAGNYTAGFPSFWEGGVPKGRGCLLYTSDAADEL